MLLEPAHHQIILNGQFFSPTDVEIVLAYAASEEIITQVLLAPLHFSLMI